MLPVERAVSTSSAERVGFGVAFTVPPIDQREGPGGLVATHPNDDVPEIVYGFISKLTRNSKVF